MNMNIRKSNFIIHSLLLGLLVLFFMLSGSLLSAADDTYPIKVEIIEKSQATYDTPENTLAAAYSASVKGDMEWFYECLTPESVEQFKLFFKEAEKDPRDLFKPVDVSQKEFYIVKKDNYKGTVLLI
ncbi:MAG: hypothetical protein SWH68_04295 [Thermodesulfobacteriota bacterium]|nr:hypothetical protein [Thermodesulfobacteriota bacterium]